MLWNFIKVRDNLNYFSPFFMAQTKVYQIWQIFDKLAKLF